MSVYESNGTKEQQLRANRNSAMDRAPMPERAYPGAKARFRSFGRDAKAEALAYLDATAKATADSSAALRNDKQKTGDGMVWVGGLLQSNPEFYPLPKSAGTGASCRVTKRCGSQQALLSRERSDCISRSASKDASAASSMAAAPASTGRSML